MSTKTSDLEKRLIELEVRVKMIEEKLNTTTKPGDPKVGDIKIGEVANLLKGYLGK